MVTFAPQQPYALVLIGYNSLSYLMTRERTARCLQLVHGWLRHGGLLLLMIQRIDPSAYRSSPKVVDWLDRPLLDPDRGFAVGSKFVTYLEPSGERLVKERTYRIVSSAGAVRLVQSVTYTPIFTVSEYVNLLQTAGFAVEVFNGYTEQAADESTVPLCFVCRAEPSGDPDRYFL